jgi:predicted polyphosphate/ATP-dependent NAD kinase
MIVLITGGREYRNQREMFAVLDKLHAERKFTFLVHGDARGADQMSHRWAKKRGVQPVAMEALWDAEGDASGTLRNARMLEFSKPDLVVAFSGGRGTANMMRIARKAGVELIDAEDL